MTEAATVSFQRFQRTSNKVSYSWLSGGRIIVFDLGPTNARVAEPLSSEERVPDAEQLRVHELVHQEEDLRLNHGMLRDDLVHFLQCGHLWGVLQQIHAPRAQRLFGTLHQDEGDRRVGVGKVRGEE